MRKVEIKKPEEIERLRAPKETQPTVQEVEARNTADEDVIRVGVIIDEKTLCPV